MDFVTVPRKSEPHQRTIIHLDMDCFYAQVEEIRDPKLRSQPLGISQKNIVVTCNYVAREFGVQKLMLIEEAKRLCPTLVLVNGEDLTPYRQMSQRIFELLLNYTPMVEKLGFDEDFMDVTSLVQSRLEQKTQNENESGNDDNVNVNVNDYGDDKCGIVHVEGHIWPGDGTNLDACECGCGERLVIGTQIAKEVRDDLYAQLGITCCAGVSYNKLLAKLVGSKNKPNQQTVLVSTCAENFMRELVDLHRITGIGQKTTTHLLESGVSNVGELQTCDMEFLRKKFGFETATKLRDLSLGRDMSAVRPTGKPKSIGLEDSCRPISVRTDVEERFRLLLMRLLEQVAEDGRIPIAVKVILRKFDAQKKTSHRETKQANIMPSLFKSIPCGETGAGGAIVSSAASVGIGAAKVVLAEGAQEKLLKIIMRLFERVVDLSKPFNITLIGLAFSKFQQRKVGSSSIANFLIKKTDLEVQSITSLTNTDVVSNTSESPTPSVASTTSDDAFRSSPTTFQPSDQFYRRRTNAASPIPMLVDNGSESAATNSDFSDFSETEVEPSPKKSRISRLLMAKRRCLGSSSIYSTENADVASPSKLRVSDLRLNSRDSEKDYPMNANNTASPNSSSISPTLPTAGAATTTSTFLPLHRFRTVQPPSSLASITTHSGELKPVLPVLLRELSTSSTASSPLTSPMDETIGNTTPLPPMLSPTDSSTCSVAINNISTSSITTTTTITGNLANIPCPAGVDPEVFNALPLDVQNELIASWRSSLAAAAVAVANGNDATAASSAMHTHTHTHMHQPSNASTAKAGGATASANQKNTLYRYFLRNK